MTLSPRNLKILLPYLRRYRTPLTVGFVFMLLQNFGYMKVPEYIQQILDEVTHHNRTDIIVHGLIMVGVYTLVTCVSMFLMRQLIIGASRKIEYELRERIYNKLLNLDYSFYQENETGDLVSRCTNDLTDVRTLLGPGIMYVPNALSRFVLFFPVLLSLSPRLLLVVGAMLLLLTVLVVVVMPYLRPMYRKIQEAVAVINNRVWQTVSGITTVKLYTLEEPFTRRFIDVNHEYIDHQMRVAKLRGFIWPFFIFILSMTELVILLIGGTQVIQGTMTLGQLLQFNVMIGYLTFPVLSLGWIMSLIQQGISAMGRINYILDHPQEETDGQPAVAEGEIEIEIDHLNFRYPGSTEASLKDISLTLSPGQTVGITGTVGSGKTTLLKLLTGLLKPEPGMIRINGRDLREIDAGSLFRKIAVVPQETFLFSRTLAENIALGAGSSPDMDSVRISARLAGLEQDVQTFPHGYDEVIGERGITLSGGQKQRTSIARALWKNSPVIIFDDALSSVDARTEAAILQNLRQLHTLKTLILVSHRISALREADVIYVLDDGRIIETGTHAELTAQGGLYARLARLQQMQMALAGEKDGE